LRIALLSFEYPPATGFGGIGTYTWYHARALARLGHEVDVLAGAVEPSSLVAEEHDGVRVWRHRDLRGAKLVLRQLERSRLWWTRNRLENGISMFRGLRMLLTRRRIEIAEMPECGAEGLLINHLLRGVPTVVRFHSPARLIMRYYDVRRADRDLCALTERIGMSGATTYTSCSRFLASEVSRHLAVQRPIHVIYNGIDLDLFDRDGAPDPRTDFGIPTTRPMILFTGRMERRKGIHLCVDIAASILERNDVSFVFAGDDLFGFMRDTLLPALSGRRLRGSVHHLGRLEQAQVRALVRTADVFLMPSLWESCPYSCLEAMAAGRAIVASTAGGLPEMLRDGDTGLLAEAGDADAHVRAVQRLLDDAALRARLGAAARRHVEAAHSDVAIARQSTELYRQHLRTG
jgi:glycogen(starch) synthase